jgi:hypothetical protein
MDPLGIFKDEWPVIMAAPWLSGAFFAVVAIAAWWITKQFTGGEIAGLRASLSARDERLLLAQDPDSFRKDRQMGR